MQRVRNPRRKRLRCCASQHCPRPSFAYESREYWLPGWVMALISSGKPGPDQSSKRIVLMLLAVSTTRWGRRPRSFSIRTIGPWTPSNVPT